MTTGWVARAAPLVSVARGLGGDDQLGGRAGGHGDVRRGRRGEAVTGEGEGVDVAVHAVEGQAGEGGHAEEKVPEVPPAAMVPPAPEIVAVAVPELTEVTTLPPESSTLTTGWVPRAAPLFVGGRGLGGDDQLGGRAGGHRDGVRGRRGEPPSEKREGVGVARSAPLRARPEKVATPLAAALVPPVVIDTPPLVKRSRSPWTELVVTTLPPESSTLTTGWVARAAPLFVGRAGLGGDDQLGGRAGGHGDGVRRPPW